MRTKIEDGGFRLFLNIGNEKVDLGLFPTRAEAIAYGWKLVGGR